MMRGEIGVNKISHYNYSHTATPIHQPPHFSLPLFSICLHFQTFISAASSWLDWTFFFNNSLYIISFRLVSSELYYWNWITCFMITGLTHWCASEQQGRKLWHYSWRHISISFRAVVDAAATANANNNFSQFLWLFFTANYEWDRIFGSSCKTAHAAGGFEPRWRHSQSCQLSPEIGCGSLVVLDLQAALSTSLLFFPLFIFFFTEESWIATAVWKKMLSTIVTHSYSRHVWMKECVVNGLFQNVVYPFRDAYKIIGEGFLGPCCMEGAFTAITEKRISKSEIPCRKTL